MRWHPRSVRAGPPVRLTAVAQPPMLREARSATRLPARDLDRARTWYAEKLGLEPEDERDGGLLYFCGGTTFALFLSQGASNGSFSQMALEVEDIDAVVASLRRRGVDFEQVDLPGLETVDGIAEIDGYYPSLGRGERAAWFRDCEGNMIGLSQVVR